MFASNYVPTVPVTKVLFTFGVLVNTLLWSFICVDFSLC